MVTHESGSQTGATGMKLYSVAYSTWNSSFSDLNRHNILAVGTGAEEAIQRAKEIVEKDAVDFRAQEITNVMGFKIVPLGDGLSEGRLAQSDLAGNSAGQTTGEISLTLAAAEQCCPLVLPASDETLDHIRNFLGVEDFTEAVIGDIKFSNPHLAEIIPLDTVTVEQANALAQCIQQMEQDDELGKFCAALEVEQPDTFSKALTIAMDVDDYESVPENMEEYGRQVLQRIGADDEVLDTIDGFMDFAALGKFSMEEDGVRRTEFGLVRRLSAPFPPQRETGMQMQ